MDAVWRGEHLNDDQERELTATLRGGRAKLERLLDSMGEEAPPAEIFTAFRELGALNSFSTASDAALQRCREAVETADKAWTGWYSVLRRRDTFGEGLRKRQWREWMVRWIVVPLLFAGLIAMFWVLFVRSFLNR